MLLSFLPTPKERFYNEQPLRLRTPPVRLHHDHDHRRALADLDRHPLPSLKHQPLKEDAVLYAIMVTLVQILISAVLVLAILFVINFALIVIKAIREVNE